MVMSELSLLRLIALHTHRLEPGMRFGHVCHATAPNISVGASQTEISQSVNYKIRSPPPFVHNGSQPLPGLLCTGN
mgnify:CR=1 FL=1